MKVRELAALLDEQDPEADVATCQDGFYAPVEFVSTTLLVGHRGEVVVVE